MDRRIPKAFWGIATLSEEKGESAGKTEECDLPGTK